MRRVLLLVVLWALSLAAIAGGELSGLAPPNGPYFQVSGVGPEGQPPYASKSAASTCSVWAGAFSQSGSWTPGGQFGYGPPGSCVASGSFRTALGGGGACPANSADLDNNDGFMRCMCATGWKPDEAGTACIPEGQVCEAGTVKTMNVRVGYAAVTANPSGVPWQTNDGRHFYSMKPDQPDPFSPDRVPPTLCDGTCSWSIQGGSHNKWGAADMPDENGYHAMYRQIPYIRGTACSTTPVSPEIDPTVKSPPCAGDVGSVNGQTKCIARIPPAGIGGQTPTLTPTPAGSTPKDTTDTSGVPIKMGPNGELPGKPGDTPGMTDLSGTGKSTTSTPSTGTSTSTNADGSTKTTSISIDLQTCGVPGKPACRFDESGTPTKAPDTVKLDEEGLGEKAGELRGKITGNADKGFLSGWANLFVTPSPVECSALVMPVGKGGQTVSIDPCPVVGGVRALMAWLWALAAFWLCLGWIREAV